MSEQNVTESVIVPEVPKVIPNEEIYVYVPVATKSAKGIASFDDKSMNVVDGVVSVKDSYIKGLVGSSGNTGSSGSVGNIDEIPMEGSSNAVSSDGVFNAIRDVKNEVAGLVDYKVSTKQDLLVAGDGIKIEGNVISAIGGGSSGGGSSGGTSGSKTVTYRDSEYGISFKATFPQEMTSVRDICEFLYEQGHEYGGNTYDVDECKYYGETVYEYCGIYGQWDGDYPLLYLYLYGSEYPLHEEGFNFSGEGNYGETIGYLLRASEFDLAFFAPEGFSTLEDLWNWMREAGYTDTTGLPLNYIYINEAEYTDVEMTAGEAHDFDVRFSTGEWITSFNTDESYDYFGNSESCP